MADAPPPAMPDPEDREDPDPAGAAAADVPASDDPQYHSLYRRFRPQRFDQVLGQGHVTRALRNAVREGRVAHAYLFSGPRGTGKTSTARILAMALNCTNLRDGEPCGVCESCVEIRRGASVDVHELDAASNRKLDEMRDLLSRVALGTRGRWKVYIVDEVHQLTPDAASALLKTLEEPPGHVVFVLATTDPQKVLPTIRSRTLHFEFHLLGSEVLGELLRSVNARAALGVAPEAIDLVVRRGHGSARDALTVLDQVAAAGVVEDEETVVAEIVDGLAERDAGRVLLAVAEGMASGRDPRRLAADLVEHLRNGLLATMARSLVMLPDDAVVRVEEQARQLGTAALVRAIETIGEALADMRDSVDPRVTLEVALVRLARPEADRTPGAMLQRIERLERTLSAGVPAPLTVTADKPVAAPGAPGDAVATPRAPLPPEAAPPASPREPERSGGPLSDARAALGVRRGAPPPARPVPAATPSVPTREAPPPPPFPPRTASPAAAGGLPSRDDLTKAWGDGILRNLPGKARSRFASGRFLSVGDGAAVFAVPDRHMLARCEETKADAEAALAARFGRPVPLRLVLDPGGPAVPDDPGAGRHPPDDDALLAEQFDALEDAGAAVTSPEQRLLEAFPGAEEVLP